MELNIDSFVDQHSFICAYISDVPVSVFDETRHQDCALESVHRMDWSRNGSHLSDSFLQDIGNQKMSTSHKDALK